VKDRGKSEGERRVEQFRNIEIQRGDVVSYIKRNHN
jgi:hypothetical protein